jgi:hypothetical protein
MCASGTLCFGYQIGMGTLLYGIADCLVSYVWKIELASSATARSIILEQSHSKHILEGHTMIPF